MRKPTVAGCVAALSLVIAFACSPTAYGGTTGRTDLQSGRIVSAKPAAWTPNIIDGTVYSLTQVGNQIVVGGIFDQVEDAGSTTVLTRHNLFAFDATTGAVSPTFAPNPDGTVYKVQAAADGTSVYVGGSFSTVTSGGNSVATKNLYRADVATGNQDGTFTAPTVDGPVRDLEVTGDRLWVAGKFAHVGYRSQPALATLNATTGAYDPYFTGEFAGLHNPGLAGSVTDVLQISTNPSNTRLIAVGNFTSVDGVARSQIAMIVTSGTTKYALAAWRTNLYTSKCSSRFDTYMTDAEYSPDGRFIVVSTSGAWGGAASNASTSGCDVVARFGTNGSPTRVMTPTWAAYTGGDTTWTVEVTDNVVYAGGHQRWQNNPTSGNLAGQGAVSRTGIAALDTLNGMPYSWNPTRTRGVGVHDMLANASGLFVGSDTDVFADETHRSLAFVPLASGEVLPTYSTATLPASVYTVGISRTQLVRRTFDGSRVTSTADARSGPGWGNVVGAFELGTMLYTATADGTLRKQTFDGSNYGPSTPVDTADLLVRQTAWHVGDIPVLTSLFYSGGRIYFTKLGATRLYSRGFEPESDVVGQLRYSSASVTGVSYGRVRGAFVAGGRLYFATGTGRLFAATWSGTAAVAGTAKLLGSAGSSWASRAMFVDS